MRHGPEFFQTIMGKRFFEGQVPKTIRTMERLAKAMEEMNERLDKLQPMLPQSKAKESASDPVTAIYVVKGFMAEDCFRQEAWRDMEAFAHQGEIELLDRVRCLGRQADVAYEALASSGDYVGVFAHAVAEPLGAMIAKHLAAHQKLPAYTSVREWAEELIRVDLHVD